MPFYRRRGRRRNYGQERALQHIQEAKDLSRELGGTDEDVKSYFFSLVEVAQFFHHNLQAMLHRSIDYNPLLLN